MHPERRLFAAPIRDDGGPMQAAEGVGGGSDPGSDRHLPPLRSAPHRGRSWFRRQPVSDSGVRWPEEEDVGWVMTSPSLPPAVGVADVPAGWHAARLRDGASSVERWVADPHLDTTVPFWIDVGGATGEDMAALGRLFGLHPVTQRDCVQEDTAVTDEKWEVFGHHTPGAHYLFLIVDRIVPSDEPGRLRTENLNIVVFENAVLTLHNGAAPPAVADVMRSLQRSPERWTAADVLVGLVEGTVHAARPFVLQSTAEIDELEHAMDLAAGATEEVLRTTALLRARLGKLQGSLMSKRVILGDLLRGLEQGGRCGTTPLHRGRGHEDHAAISPMHLTPGHARAAVGPDGGLLSASSTVYLGAVLDTVTWTLSRVDSMVDAASALQARCIGTAQLRMAERQQRVAEVMQFQAVILTVTMPLTLIASVAGMNVYPLSTVQVSSSQSGSYLPFALLIGGMLVLSLVVLVLARRNKWL